AACPRRRTLEPYLGRTEVGWPRPLWSRIRANDIRNGSSRGWPERGSFSMMPPADGGRTVAKKPWLSICLSASKLRLPTALSAFAGPFTVRSKEGGRGFEHVSVGPTLVPPLRPPAPADLPA